MTDETTANPVVMAGDLITGPGLYQARCGDLVQITRWRAGWWVSEWKGIRTDYHSDGRKRLRTEADAGRWDLLHWVAPLPASEPEPETTTEQLAEIEGQAEAVQVREGRWRTRGGSIRNVTPTPQDHESFPAAYLWWDGFDTWRNDGRWWAAQETTSDLVEYLGPIEQDKTQELPEYTPPEGWRVLQSGELLQPGDEIVQIDDGRRYPTHRIGDAVGPNQQYIRRIEPEPQPQPQQNGLVRDFTHQLEESGVLDLAKAEQRIEELRSEVSYVQNLLGTERRRVTELEELVGSLRTINRGCENAVRDAGKENFALKNQLEAVKAELAQVSKDRYALQIELDAAQQVPADSPELRQLRADLAEVTRERDQHLDSYQRIFGDLETIRETTKAAAVEAIAEWLEPIRAVDNEHLANEAIQHLPQIMRHLTGLAQD